MTRIGKIIALLFVASAAAAQTTFANIRDFGAIPNDGIDDGLALQAAFDALNQDQGGTVFCPAGTYDIYTPVVIQAAAARFAGDAGIAYNEDYPYAGCSLVARTDDMTMLTVRRKDLDHRGPVFEYINMRDGTHKGHSATLLDIDSFNRWTLRDVTAHYANIGLKIEAHDDASWGYVAQFFCRQSNTCIEQSTNEGGFLLLGGGIEPLVTGVHVRASQVRIVGTKFDCWQAATGVLINGQAASVTASIFELCGVGIDVRDDGSTQYNGDQNRLIGNHFLAATVDGSVGISLSRNADGNQLVGNTYEWVSTEVSDKGKNNLRLEHGMAPDLNMSCAPGQAVRGLNVRQGLVIGVTCGQP